MSRAPEALDPKFERRVLGVRFRRFRAPRTGFHLARGQEPRIHVGVYNDLKSYYYWSCKGDEGYQPNGTLVTYSTEVTCNQCQHSNGARNG